MFVAQFAIETGLASSRSLRLPPLVKLGTSLTGVMVSCAVAVVAL